MSMKMANEVLGRFNLRESLVATQFDGGMALAFYHTLREADDSLEDASWEVSGRDKLLASYGFSSSGPAKEKPFAFAQGLAIIPVQGMMVNRFSSSWGSMTGYNFVRNQMNAALADPDVKGIVYDVNTNGGEAAGCFELCAEILASRAVKPSIAVVDSSAYSAGYAIASSASKVIAAPSAGVGSIGVVVMHASLEGMLNKAGVEITFIHAGKHKVDGNMFQNLPADVKDRVQKSVNKSYSKFVSVVSDNRADLNTEDIRKTEALTYNADDALDMGLIDEVATPQAAIQSFINELSGSTTTKGKTMDKNAESGDGKQALTAEDINKAKAEAATAERARMSAIMGCDEAKGKSKLANHIAMNTSMSLDEAKGMLAASAPEVTSDAATADNKDGFKAHMDAAQHPNVGAGSGKEGGQEMTASQRILAAQAQAHGGAKK